MEATLPKRRHAGTAGSFRGVKHRSGRSQKINRRKDSKLSRWRCVANRNAVLILACLRIAGSGRMSAVGVAENSTSSNAGFAVDHLRSFIERVERLEEEKAALTEDLREVYSEAKGSGFDTKIMRQVVRLRKLDRADFQEREAILDLYMTALGMR